MDRARRHAGAAFPEKRKHRRKIPDAQPAHRERAVHRQRVSLDAPAEILRQRRRRRAGNRLTPRRPKAVQRFAAEQKESGEQQQRQRRRERGARQPGAQCAALHERPAASAAAQAFRRGVRVRRLRPDDDQQRKQRHADKQHRHAGAREGEKDRLRQHRDRHRPGRAAPPAAGAKFPAGQRQTEQGGEREEIRGLVAVGKRPEAVFRVPAGHLGAAQPRHDRHRRQQRRAGDKHPCRRAPLPTGPAVGQDEKKPRQPGEEQHEPLRRQPRLRARGGGERHGEILDKRPAPKRASRGGGVAEPARRQQRGAAAEQKHDAECRQPPPERRPRRRRPPEQQRTERDQHDALAPPRRCPAQQDGEQRQRRQQITGGNGWPGSRVRGFRARVRVGGLMRFRRAPRPPPAGATDGIGRWR